MSDIPSLLPANACPLERDLEQFYQRFSGISQPITVLWDPENCPAHVLPWLAWAFSVDQWDPAWPEATKRATIAASISVHRRKGTIGAVKRALVAAGYGDAEVVERFNWQFYDGSVTHDGSINHEEPDHWAEYRVILERPITVDQAARVRELLGAVAPARCHLNALDFRQALNIYDARITHDGSFTHGVA